MNFSLWTALVNSGLDRACPACHCYRDRPAHLLKLSFTFYQTLSRHTLFRILVPVVVSSWRFMESANCLSYSRPAFDTFDVDAPQQLVVLLGSFAPL